MSTLYRDNIVGINPFSRAPYRFFLPCFLYETVPDVT